MGLSSADPGLGPGRTGITCRSIPAIGCIRAIRDLLPPASADDLHASHVGAQHLGYHDAAIGLLIVLQDADERARQRQARAVQRVHELDVFAVARAVADVGPPRLEIQEVQREHA